MDIAAILGELEERRDRISHAISLLQGNAKRNGKHDGRKRRGMSAAGRKRISDAMKRRWAAKKRAA
jgi:hypothetical protein